MSVQRWEPQVAPRRVRRTQTARVLPDEDVYGPAYGVSPRYRRSASGDLESGRWASVGPVAWQPAPPMRHYAVRELRAAVAAIALVVRLVVLMSVSAPIVVIGWRLVGWLV